MRQILFLAQAEVLHIVRDRILLAQTLVVPMVQLLVLSSAATFEIRNTPIQIVDFDRSSASRGAIASRFRSRSTKWKGSCTGRSTRRSLRPHI